MSKPITVKLISDDSPDTLALNLERYLAEIGYKGHDIVSTQVIESRYNWHAIVLSHDPELSFKPSSAKKGNK